MKSLFPSHALTGHCGGIEVHIEVHRTGNKQRNQHTALQQHEDVWWLLTMELEQLEEQLNQSRSHL